MHFLERFSPKHLLVLGYNLLSTEVFKLLVLVDQLADVDFERLLNHRRLFGFVGVGLRYRLFVDGMIFVLVVEFGGRSRGWAYRNT